MKTAQSKPLHCGRSNFGPNNDLLVPSECADIVAECVLLKNARYQLSKTFKGDFPICEIPLRFISGDFH